MRKRDKQTTDWGVAVFSISWKAILEDLQKEIVRSHQCTVKWKNECYKMNDNVT